MGNGEDILAVVSAAAEFINGLAAGVAETEDSGGFVEAFARRIVPGGANNVHIRVGTDIHDDGVAAGYGKADEGRLQLGICQIVGCHMSADMVDGDERYAQSACNAFCEVDAHEHRAYETGGEAYGNGIYVALFYAGFLNSAVCKLINGLNVVAGGNFGHDAAVDGVEVSLRIYLVCKDLPSVTDKGNGGLVAG